MYVYKVPMPLYFNNLVISIPNIFPMWVSESHSVMSDSLWPISKQILMHLLVTVKLNEKDT